MVAGPATEKRRKGKKRAVITSLVSILITIAVYATTHKQLKCTHPGHGGSGIRGIVLSHLVFTYDPTEDNNDRRQLHQV